VPWQVLPADSQVLAVHAALLHTGKIVYFSGDEHDPGLHAAQQFDHTRLYDCATGTVSVATSPTSDVFCSGHSLLGDGRLLVAGGSQEYIYELPDEHEHHGHFTGLRDAWVFDPGPETWTRVAYLNPEPGKMTGGGRWYPTLVTLPDGRVLALAGHPGEDDSRHYNNSPELFSASPAPVGSWTLLGPDDPVHGTAWYPRVHVLPSGDVFFVTRVGLRNMRLNVATRTWTDVCAIPADMIYEEWRGSSVLLPLLPVDNYRARVLLMGAPQPQIVDLDAVVPAWTNTSPRVLAGTPYRNHLNAAILPTGDVFVCGGVSTDRVDATAVLAAELYQPGTDAWTQLESATVVREYHSVALLMPDGRVWTCGTSKNGQFSFPAPGVDNRELRIELYEPAYYRRSRPKITAAPSTVHYAASFDVRTTKAAHISRVSVVRAGSVTHSFDPDQRYVGIEFVRMGGNRLRCKAPPNANIAPPGYYLLFVIDDKGVPSVGHWLHIFSAKVVKELKAELKEHKEYPEKSFKQEFKEKDKDLIEGLPPVEQPFELIDQIAQRIDELEERLARGRAFIREEERPPPPLGEPGVPGEHAHGEPSHDHEDGDEHGGPQG
jgi:hypothetical protein